jgi:enoyl-CoA hydratase/carnithine racemase
VTGLATIRVSHPGDGIAEVTLDRPAAMNAVSSAMAAGLDVEDAAWRTAAASPDRREGIAAFAEKRKPVWPGR